MSEERVLGIDLGGTHMRLGLVDRQHTVSDFTMVKTQEVFAGEDPINRLVEHVKQYCSVHLNGERPAAVAIGFPSTIDRARRVVMSTPNIPGLNHLPVVEIMEQALGVPVFINRDVNFLMLHDLTFFGLEATPIVLGFYVGTGFGNAVAVNGRLMLGKHGMAAELGHIPMYRVRERCGCGNEGCAETVASGLHLTHLHQQFFPDEPMDELFVRHPGDPVLQEFVDALSLPIATEISIFDPDCIILGGGIFQMKRFPMDYLAECIARHVRKPFPGLDFQILCSSAGQKSGIIGAGIYAFHRMLDKSYL